MVINLQTSQAFEIRTFADLRGTAEVGDAEEYRATHGETTSRNG